MASFAPPLNYHDIGDQCLIQMQLAKVQEQILNSQRKLCMNQSWKILTYRMSSCKVITSNKLLLYSISVLDCLEPDRFHCLFYKPAKLKFLKTKKNPKCIGN